MATERLDKLLASQGTSSRKEVHTLIRSGKVTVDGVPVRTADARVDASTQKIAVNGTALHYQQMLYLMLNKPAGVISASADPKAETVVDLVPAQWKRKDLFPVGRLDKDTRGLLLITNDGDFAHRILSPKKEVYKCYEAELDGPVGEAEIRAFETGVTFADGTVCLPAGLRVIRPGAHPLVMIRIREGKFHQVKKMALAVGRTVLSLKRVRIGALALDEALPEGACRELTEAEKAALFVSDGMW